jgi:hypothetical protein
VTARGANRYRFSLYSVFVCCLLPDESTFVSFVVVFCSLGFPMKSFFTLVSVSVTFFSSAIGWPPNLFKATAVPGVVAAPQATIPGVVDALER